MAALLIERAGVMSRTEFLLVKKPHRARVFGGESVQSALRRRQRLPEPGEAFVCLWPAERSQEILHSFSDFAGNRRGVQVLDELARAQRWLDARAPSEPRRLQQEEDQMIVFTVAQPGCGFLFDGADQPWEVAGVELLPGQNVLRFGTKVRICDWARRCNDLDCSQHRQECLCHIHFRLHAAM